MATYGLDADGAIAMTHIPAVDLHYGSAITERFTVDDGDPLSAASDTHHRIELRRDGWHVSIEIRTSLRATVDSFLVTASLTARHDGLTVFERTVTDRIPRGCL